MDLKAWEATIVQMIDELRDQPTESARQRILRAWRKRLVATNRHFAKIGRGTLAPWNPTSQLVVEGVYRNVRNPMISGVFAILLGKSLVAGSVPLFVSFLIFVAINAIYIPFFEERGLERRFGAAYDEYRRHVPRWIPRLRPWIKE